ncbi:hypothetical protein PIB30_031934 [Stylosanthes scabra]|uniref:Putative plant transposon protein domain-containing protein n=1 Tax=Stylosanthes scabra TaxID=79078 RepID=A0ABU6ZAS3_9FABA|nr:hypothetical protein [Stylosanthes scabra]
MSSSSSKEGDIFDEHCFRSLYNQKLFEETVSKKEIIPEKGFDCDEEEVSKNLVREFYANANRSKEEMEELQVHPYTSRVRGVEIDFSPTNLVRVMRFKEETPGAENSFENKQNGDQQLDAVIRDLCIQGASWKMGTGRDPKPIQLRRQELRPLARGWQELIIHNIILTGNKSEITIARAVLIHSIIQGDDNYLQIVQRCRSANERVQTYRTCAEERYITAKVMEATRIPRMIQQNQHHEEEEEEEDEEDQAIP